MDRGHSPLGMNRICECRLEQDDRMIVPSFSQDNSESTRLRTCFNTEVQRSFVKCIDAIHVIMESGINC